MQNNLLPQPISCSFYGMKHYQILQTYNNFTNNLVLKKENNKKKTQLRRTYHTSQYQSNKSFKKQPELSQQISNKMKWHFKEINSPAKYFLKPSIRSMLGRAFAWFLHQSVTFRFTKSMPFDHTLTKIIPIVSTL